MTDTTPNGALGAAAPNGVLIVPTYHYLCDACDQSNVRVCSIAEMEDFEGTTGALRCACGDEMRRDLRMRRSPAFKAGFYEHVSEGGAHCETMQELKSAAHAAGNYSTYAEDMGSMFGAKEGRWI